MAAEPVAQEIRPISHWSTNDYIFELVVPFLQDGARIVDVGAGEGFFSKKMADYLQSTHKDPKEALFACDLFPEGFRYDGIGCDPVGMDGRLPYPDASFDVACSLEVIEHLEDQFHFTRELARILKPGGIAIISTPNVLNVNSRLRVLRSGFAVLFDPLSLSSTDPVHTSGHIHPVSYYYIAYMLVRAGFVRVTPHYDRLKNSARFLLAVSAAYLYVGRYLFRSRLKSRKAAIEHENHQILDDLNSVSMLTSRSVITVATKG